MVCPNCLYTWTSFDIWVMHDKCFLLRGTIYLNHRLQHFEFCERVESVPKWHGSKGRWYPCNHSYFGNMSGVMSDWVIADLVFHNIGFKSWKYSILDEILRAYRPPKSDDVNQSIDYKTFVNVYFVKLYKLCDLLAQYNICRATCVIRPHYYYY